MTNRYCDYGKEEVQYRVAKRRHERPHQTSEKCPHHRTTSRCHRMDEFKNVSEHGECVWLFKDVKREIERIKFESDAKLNIRQLVNAILLAFVKEHREDLKNIRSG